MASFATYSGQDSCEGKWDTRRQLSFRQLSYGGDENTISEELEFLKTIYLDEMTSDPRSCDSTGCVLHFRVTPRTGDDKEKQYVYVFINMEINDKYPTNPPEISLGQSRGLSDAHLRSMLEGLCRTSVELVGTPMVYELVEFAKDCLTDNNKPTEECAICLSNFQNSDEFKKTDCYHYFHLPCLAGYLEFYKKQVREAEEEETRVDLMLRKKFKPLECPVCRAPMTTDILSSDLPHDWCSPSSSQGIFSPTPELRIWQEEMRELLSRQKLKGGYIDPSYDRHVIDETWVSTARLKDNTAESTRYLSTRDSTGVKIRNHTADPTKTVDNSFYVRKRRIGQKYSGPLKGGQNVNSETFKSSDGDKSKQGIRGHNPHKQNDSTQNPRQSRPYKQNGRRVKATNQEKTSTTNQSVDFYQKKLDVPGDKLSLQLSVVAIMDTTSTKEKSKDEGCVSSTCEKTHSFVPQSKCKTSYKNSEHSRKRPQKPLDRNFKSKKSDTDLHKESGGPPLNREGSEI